MDLVVVLGNYLRKEVLRFFLSNFNHERELTFVSSLLDSRRLEGKTNKVDRLVGFVGETREGPPELTTMGLPVLTRGV